ncbi:hypothetical protein BH10ACT11_BH10ACT11_08640 [soil metagenome]
MDERDTGRPSATNGSRAWDAARSIDREAAGGMARVAAGAWMRSARWGVKTYARAGRRVAGAAVHMENPVNLVEDAGREVVEGARKLLGGTDL